MVSPPVRELGGRRRLLETHLPNALSVQEYDGDGWLSVVPFVNVHTRPRDIPARLGVRLPELNLRTYVTCDGKPGVYFFSLDAHGLAGVLGARLLYHLPYYYARMRLEWTTDAGGCALRAVDCIPATDRLDSRSPTGPTANRARPTPARARPF